MNEVIREFLLETHENLAQLDLDLVTLEKSPGERETLSRIFRTLHTIKGTAGFLGLPRLQAVAHAAESLLGGLRDGKVLFSPEVASGLLSAVDAVRRLLASLEAHETEGDADYSSVILTLDRLKSGSLVGAASVSAPPRTVITAPPPPPALPESPPRPKKTPAAVAPPTPAPPPKPPPVEPVEVRTPAVSDSAVRVDVGLLDKLMTLVGELVLARNQIIQFSGSQENTAFLGTVQRLNLLTTELQANVMKTRMQPIGNIWSKFPRVVRDLAVACGKQVRLDMAGQDTELDRSIVEAIRDPLTHLVRNAVDHGIEPPRERAAQNKPAEGRLSLTASHEGGNVHIEITDDGAGIDPQRVRARAVQANVLTAEQAARLTDREAINLIFLPGFSTAEKVTQFSGRGVGLDVVRTNVERVGGTVEIESRLGRGTTLKLKIPLTLAIIPALTITCGGDRYAIPQVSLLELVRLEGERATRGIESLHGAPVYRLRGNLLPLVHLHQVLHVEAMRVIPGEVNIVVLQADDRQFGLIVDAIHDTEEIVVKPLQKQVKGISVFAGATILGDGTVALILDVLGLAQRARVVATARERSRSETVPSLESAVPKKAILLFASHDGGRMGIPLAQVARLEEFPRSALERLGSRYVVQYRDEILPLVNVMRALRPRRDRNDNGREDGRLPAKPAEGPKTLQVIVCSVQGRRIGLIVSQILDIIAETPASRTEGSRPGVLFTAVVQGRVTEFLDIEWILRSLDASVVEPPHAVGAEV